MRKPTISEALATKLGRKPTYKESCAEVKRILEEVARERKRHTTKAESQAFQAIEWITAACALDSLSHFLNKENEQKQRLARHIKRYGDKKSKAFVRISENVAYWHSCYVFSIRKIQQNLTTGV